MIQMTLDEYISLPDVDKMTYSESDIGKLFRPGQYPYYGVHYFVLLGEKSEEDYFLGNIEYREKEVNIRQENENTYN